MEDRDVTPWRGACLLALILAGGCGGAHHDLTPVRPPSSTAVRTPERSYFFRGRDFGTDAYIGPVDILLNKAFATAQWEGNGRNILSYDYGWSAVWRSVSAPDHTARMHRGWRQVLLTNFVPFNGASWNTWQWYPNYLGHVVEGGVAYRRMEEWLRYQGVPGSPWWAAVLTYTASVVNEAYEVTPWRPWVDEHGSANTMVDLYFFDPVGMLLFAHDGVARFFAESLHARLWPSQASLLLNDATLVNNAQQVVMKLPVPFTDAVSVFFRSGMGVEFGLAHRLGGGRALSWGLGGEGSAQTIDAQTRLERISSSLSASLWLDDDGVLLASAQWNRGTDRRFSVNLYPGVLPEPWSGAGLWFVLDGLRRPHLGITYRGTWGAGAGIRLGG